MTNPTEPTRQNDAPTAQPQRPDVRKVRGGVRLRLSDAALRVDRRSAAWLRLLEQRVSRDAVQVGYEYAEMGQATTFDMKPGKIVADIQGRQPRPQRVEIGIRLWDEHEWRDIVEAIAAEPAASAAALVHDVPEATVALLDARGRYVVPSDPSELHVSYGSDDAEERDAAVACALFLAAQRSINTPSDLFVVRGLQMPAIVERLSQHRMIESRGAVAAHDGEAFASLPASEPLEACCESFWNEPPDAPEVRIGSSHAPHALLRRMGPSPLAGRFPIVGLLASVYDDVSRTLIAEREQRVGRMIDDTDDTSTASTPEGV